MKKEVLIDIFYAALNKVDPYTLLKKGIEIHDDRLIIKGEYICNMNDFERFVVVGAGKATASMAQAIEDIFEDRIRKGKIIVKYGHSKHLRIIKQLEASHPIPDEAGVRGTEEIIELIKGADEKTLVICLLSGGASALLISPCEGITLCDKKVVTGALLKAGATIDELNTVRKHLSGVKGGRLAEIAWPATLITLLLSDVTGDRLDVIASGPTVPDSTTFGDAMSVINKYSLISRLPDQVAGVLEDGVKGKIKDTAKGGETFFEKTRTIIIGSIMDALIAAKERAVTMGFETEIITSELKGEARDVAKHLASIVNKEKVVLIADGKIRCLLSGGETTVTVNGNGLGGRNQELALSFAMEIKGLHGITLLSAGTDGTDGITDAAGAIVDGETFILAKRYGLDLMAYLDNNDSYNFFKRLDMLSHERYHLITGPTGTNVMDIQLIIMEG